MKTRFPFTLAALALVVALATPLAAQDADVAKDEAAAKHAEMMKSHNEMMGEGETEGCQCSCMKEMQEKMMEMHGDADEHAEGMDDADADEHAEGMDSDEDHAEMMQAHKEMMANCKCMAGEGDEAMSCKMHEDHGAMGEMDEDGMEHEHADKDNDADDDGEG